MSYPRSSIVLLPLQWRQWRYPMSYCFTFFCSFNFFFEELLWRHLAQENLVQMGNKNIFDDHSKQYGWYRCNIRSISLSAVRKLPVFFLIESRFVILVLCNRPDYPNQVSHSFTFANSSLNSSIGTSLMASSLSLCVMSHTNSSFFGVIGAPLAAA